MVRKTTLKTKIFSSLIFSTFLTFLNVVTTYATCTIVDGHTQCEEGANFQVNIPEVLTIQITSPNSWAIGEAGAFLRNKITLDVTSNNAAGFSASMTTNDTTANGSALININSTNEKIPLKGADGSSNNIFWGYSFDGSDAAGSTYAAPALKGATPTSLITSNTAGHQPKDIYFGAKADSSVASGTYKGTVIISAVSGVVTPVTPVDPAKPEDTDPENPHYEPADDPGNTSGEDRTTHTDIAFNNDSTNTSTIEVSEGDTRDYYTEPKGVSTATINEGTPLATGLAVTAVVAATAGICFFIIARRREEEDDDEY